VTGATGAGAAATGSPFCGPQAVTTIAAHSALRTTLGVYQVFAFMLLSFRCRHQPVDAADRRAAAAKKLSPRAASRRRKPAFPAVGQRRRAPRAT
jgi:hypothetical protein